MLYFSGKRWLKTGKVAKMGQGMKMRKVTVMQKRVVRGGYQNQGGSYRQGAYSMQEGGANGNGLNNGAQPKTDPSQRMLYLYYI